MRLIMNTSTLKFPLKYVNLIDHLIYYKIKSHNNLIIKLKKKESNE